MKITDKFFENSFSMEVNDPYLTSLKILDRMRDFYSVSEKFNEYKTDGPNNMSDIDFIVEKKVDDYASIRMDFELHGHENRLDIRITGSIVLVLDNYGLFSETFTTFYMEKIYKGTKENCEKVIDEINKRFERALKIS